MARAWLREIFLGLMAFGLAAQSEIAFSSGFGGALVVRNHKRQKLAARKMAAEAAWKNGGKAAADAERNKNHSKALACATEAIKAAEEKLQIELASTRFPTSIKEQRQSAIATLQDTFPFPLSLRKKQRVAMVRYKDFSLSRGFEQKEEDLLALARASVDKHYDDKLRRLNRATEEYFKRYLEQGEDRAVVDAIPDLEVQFKVEWKIVGVSLEKIWQPIKR